MLCVVSHSIFTVTLGGKLTTLPAHTHTIYKWGNFIWFREVKQLAQITEYDEARINGFYIPRVDTASLNDTGSQEKAQELLGARLRVQIQFHCLLWELGHAFWTL